MTCRSRILPAVDVTTLLVGCALFGLAACTATPGDTPAPAAAADRPATASETPRRPAPVNDDPARLLGLDAAGLAALLGEPVRVRRDGTAEIRQFGTPATCQIDTFLYPDAGRSQVTHVEVRRGFDRLAGAGARTCLRALMGAITTS